MASIILDFDGTISDSFDVIVSIFYELTHRREPLGEDAMRRLRQEPLLLVARRLGVHVWQIPSLLFRGRRMMRQRMHEVTLHSGMGKVIEQLHAEGHELFILSSNAASNVLIFLHDHHLTEQFVAVKGSVGLLGKKRALKRLIERHHLVHDQVWYIGDEMRDVEAAKANGVNSIAVIWGFAEPTTLDALQPTAIAHQSADIVTIING